MIIYIYIAISAGAFYSLGVTINPTISSAAMSISSIVVVLISNTMRLFNLDPSERL
jgi:cation transport ATPase